MIWVLGLRRYFVPQSSPGRRAAQGSGAATTAMTKAATTTTAVKKRIFDDLASMDEFALKMSLNCESFTHLRKLE